MRSRQNFSCWTGCGSGWPAARTRGRRPCCCSVPGRKASTPSGPCGPSWPGNDVGFAPRILLSSLPGPLRALPSIRRQLASFADPELTEQRFTRLRENLLQLAAEVRKRAPRSQLLFVEYLTVLPPDATWPTGVLPADVADWGRRIAVRMGETTQQAAEEASAIFVPAGAFSAGHHAWSADPWTRQFHLTLHGGAPYHPNAKGMAAVADLVAESLPPAPA